MDYADDAQRQIEAEDAETLRRARRNDGRSFYQCEDCFTIIPEARKKACPGARKCRPCQEASEKV